MSPIKFKDIIIFDTFDSWSFLKLYFVYTSTNTKQVSLYKSRYNNLAIIYEAKQ